MRVSSGLRTLSPNGCGLYSMQSEQRAHPTRVSRAYLRAALPGLEVIPRQTRPARACFNAGCIASNCRCPSG
jgi:hypothetical protein